MGFLVSPGVEVKEIDLTNVIPAVSTSIGGFAGFFNWGPSNELVTVGSEKDLVQFFGTPNTSGETETSFFTAASFLKYGRSLRVSRALSNDSANATNNGATEVAINTADELESARARLVDSGIRVVARYAGSFGNSLKVCFVNAENNTVTTTGVKQKISLPINLTDELANATGTLLLSFTPNGGSPQDLPLVDVTQGDTKEDIIASIIAVLDTVAEISDDFTITSTVDAIILESKVALANSTTLRLSVSENDIVGVIASESITIVSGVAVGIPVSGEIPISALDALSYDPGTTEFASNLITSPDKIKDEVAVVIIDADGVFGGGRGTILEVFEGLSLAKNAKNQYNESIYWASHLNKYSSYVYGVEYPTDITITADTLINDTMAMPDAVLTLGDGADGSNNNNGPVVNALALLADPEAVDVNFIFAHNFADTGTYTAGLTKTIDSEIAAIVNQRKDCLGFLSAPLKIKNQTSNSDRKAALLDKFNNTDVSSYLVCDSTPVYVYNKYRDTYVWIPASGHIAGLCANTDFISEPWFSPAGFTRGQIRGSVKLGYNPNQADRDELYKLGINPIVSFPGQGIVLYGDKTAQRKPSAFDRINVRRLFIILQKAISTAAKFQLFELNDEFTRFAFKNAIEPYLRDIQGRRGITDFRVICNEINNTGEVIDTNRFVADIYIKPARSINFITLNFIATRTGIEFKEIVGE